MIGQALLTRRTRCLPLLAAALLTINCGDDGSPVGPANPDREVTRLEISPSAVVLAEGHAQRLTAQPYNARGVPLQGRLISWSTSDPSVAGFIEPNGTLMALGAGNVTIMAECEGVSATATAQITRAVVVLVEVVPGAVELDPAEETDLEVVAYDDLGRPLSGRGTPTWESGDPNVATVTTTGRVTGRAFGAAAISATIEGVVGRGAVYLLPPPANVTELDLGTLGGTESIALGINRHGTIVGSTAQSRAFRWTTSVGMVDLGTLGGSFATASGINDNEEIVGASSDNFGVIRAFRWSATSGMEGLSVGAPGATSRATAINAAGDIVGAFGSFEVAFMRRPTGDVQVIPPLNGFVASVASAINAQRTVVGSSYNDFYYYYSSDPSRGFRWSSGALQMVDVDALRASDVNDAEVIVGQTFALRPFRSASGAPLTRLPTLGTLSPGAANAINELGQVAGQVTGATPHAAVWLASGEMILLSTKESEATGISDVGWVVGWRKDPGSNNRRATLWKIAGVSQP